MSDTTPIPAAPSIPPPPDVAVAAPSSPLAVAVRLGRLALRATPHVVAVGHATLDLVEALTRRG